MLTESLVLAMIGAMAAFVVGTQVARGIAAALAASVPFDLSVSVAPDGRVLAFTAALAQRPGGFELLTCGGFFAWVRHPFDRPTPEVVAELLGVHDVVVMPGTDFQPLDDAAMRVSVGNLGLPALDDLVGRLAAFGARA